MPKSLNEELDKALKRNSQHQTRDAERAGAIVKIASMDDEQKMNVMVKVRDAVLHNAPRTPTELWHAIRIIYDYKIPLTSTDPAFNAPFEWFSKVFFGTVQDSVALAARGGGKALDIDTPVPTPKGWVTMGDIQVGDKVFDSGGAICSVTFTTEEMHGRPCYRVRFDDDTELIADEEHLWIVHTKAVRAALKNRQRVEDMALAAGRVLRKRREGVINSPEILTTKQMLDTLGTGRYHNGTREANHAVALVTHPVAYPEAQLPLDPYLLGLWLGDGSKHHAQISTEDQEVLHAFQGAGYKVDKIEGSACDYRICPGLRTKLRELNLIKNKHVPVDYMQSSPSQRIALVQGMMDSDGTCSTDGKCTFDNGNWRLVAGLKEVLESLGVKCHVGSRIPKVNGKRCARSYRIWFTAPWLPIFRLSRKAERLRGFSRATQHYRYVKAITPVRSRPVKCIQVDSVDHSYLAGKEFVVTHNTIQASIMSDSLARWKPGWEGVHAGGTQVQAQVASSYLSQFHDKECLKGLYTGKPAKFSAAWKNKSRWKIVTGSIKGVSGQHPVFLSLDEIEFWEIDALVQTFEVPVNRGSFKRIWTAFSTRQRCLPAYTRIVTEDGPMKIGNIVNNKYRGKVRVWDNDNQCWDWRHIVEWHRNGSSTEWYKVYTKHSGLGRGCELIATGDHHVYYSLSDKKPLREFTAADTLVMPSWVPSKQQRQLILGTLLGDASIQHGSLRIEHSGKQIDYMRWWAKSFFEHVSGETHNVERDHYLIRLPACPYIHNLEIEWYGTGSKRVPGYVWEELDEQGLAVWLMDDGSYRKAGTNSGGDTWHIYCSMFNEDERRAMESWFADRGVGLTWQWTGTHHYAYIGGESARRVTTMVEPYLQVTDHIGPKRGYKRWKGMSVQPGKQGAVPVPIERIDVETSKPQGCYDIGVEGIHNYTNGSGVLVSNSFGAMNWLVDEAPKRNFALFQWTVFEMMQPCRTCEATDKEPFGDDETRGAICPLWKACRGERAKKATGWLTLEEARQKCIRLGGPDGREWQTQGLCLRPSSHGLVLHNFIKEYRPEGNYTKWTYNPDLPWYAVHDPAEGKKSVIYFLQFYDDRMYVFDELVDPICPDVTKAKQDFYAHCQRMNYGEPAVVVVDPHRTDAVATWQLGSKSGSGVMFKYNADVPDISETTGVTQLLNKTIELLRQFISDGTGRRRVLVNPDYCPCLVKAVGEYHYPTNDLTNEILSDIPVKAYSDEIDPLRYMVMYWVTKLGRPRSTVVIL